MGAARGGVGFETFEIPRETPTERNSRNAVKEAIDQGEHERCSG
jgi:hypothetical protein